MTSEAPSDLLLEDSITTATRQAVHQEALRGLKVFPKTLSPWLFYDERGSELFEQITALPEYYLTRMERRIFAQRADEIILFAGSPVSLVELGAGSAAKTGLLLAEAARRQTDVLYQPVDVSSSALEAAVQSLTAAIPRVRVEPQLANYITENYRVQRPAGHTLLGLSIGSSLGNFSPEEGVSILRRLRGHLSKPGDALLLGIDLAPCHAKSVDRLLAAYDDAAGVTGQFNLNLLTRLNRELGADFQLERFAHRARWNATESRIEMHLESLVAQSVHIGAERIAFAAGETIHTENSYKFTERGLYDLLTRSGFGSPHWLYDGERVFAVAMAHPA